MIGVLSDSHGDLNAFHTAYELLRSRGARRFLFAGARYTDLEDWLSQMGEKRRGGREYTDMDFLADVSQWLSSQEQVERPPAFGDAHAEAETQEDLMEIKSRFLRTPERDSLQYLDPAVPKKVVDMMGDTLCCLVHDKNDLTREDLQNATLFIHGKEMEPKVVQVGPRYFLTPGRLAGAVEQTCALIERVDQNLRFSALRLDGTDAIEPQLLILERRSKLSLK